MDKTCEIEEHADNLKYRYKRGLLSIQASIAHMYAGRGSETDKDKEKNMPNHTFSTHL